MGLIGLKALTELKDGQVDAQDIDDHLSAVEKYVRAYRKHWEEGIWALKARDVNIESCPFDEWSMDDFMSGLESIEDTVKDDMIDAIRNI